MVPGTRGTGGPLGEDGGRNRKECAKEANSGPMGTVPRRCLPGDCTRRPRKRGQSLREQRGGKVPVFGRKGREEAKRGIVNQRTQFAKRRKILHASRLRAKKRLRAPVGTNPIPRTKPGQVLRFEPKPGGDARWTSPRMVLHACFRTRLRRGFAVASTAAKHGTRKRYDSNPNPGTDQVGPGSAIRTQLRTYDALLATLTP
jgi:hypothetical protein